MSTTDESKEEFKTFIDRIFKPLENIEKVLLTSEYFNTLEQKVLKIANIDQTDYSINEIRESVLHDANQLRKLKRKRSYSKEKHKKGWE